MEFLSWSDYDDGDDDHYYEARLLSNRKPRVHREAQIETAPTNIKSLIASLKSML